MALKSRLLYAIESMRFKCVRRTSLRRCWSAFEFSAELSSICCRSVLLRRTQFYWERLSKTDGRPIHLQRNDMTDSQFPMRKKTKQTPDFAIQCIVLLNSDPVCLIQFVYCLLFFANFAKRGLLCEKVNWKFFQEVSDVTQYVLRLEYLEGVRIFELRIIFVLWNMNKNFWPSSWTSI